MAGIQYALPQRNEILTVSHDRTPGQLRARYHQVLADVFVAEDPSSDVFQSRTGRPAFVVFVSVVVVDQRDQVGRAEFVARRRSVVVRQRETRTARVVVRRVLSSVHGPSFRPVRGSHGHHHRRSQIARQSRFD